MTGNMNQISPRQLRSQKSKLPTAKQNSVTSVKSNNSMEKSGSPNVQQKHIDAIKHQCDDNQSMMNSLRDQIDEKFGVLNNAMQNMRREISMLGDQINEINQAKTIVPLIDTNQANASNRANDFLFKCFLQLIGNGNRFEHMVCSYANEINKKIEWLEAANMERDETLAALFDATNMNTKSNDKFEIVEAVEEIKSLENAIRCTQEHVNKVHTLAMENGERYQKHNQQLHVLSSKFVQFNARVNNFIFDHNKLFKEKIKTSKVVDSDARRFFTREAPTCEEEKKERNATQSSTAPSHMSTTSQHTHETNGQKRRNTGQRTHTNEEVHSKKDNTVDGTNAKEGSGTNEETNNRSIIHDESLDNDDNKEMSDGRFVTIQNKWASYTKYVKVCVRNEKITNTNKFVNEFGQMFGSIIGDKVVNKCFVNKCYIADGITHQAEMIVVFNVPIANQYLNSFKFPSNWHFFEMRIENTVNRSNGWLQRRCNVTTHKTTNKYNQQ